MSSKRKTNSSWHRALRKWSGLYSESAALTLPSTIHPTVLNTWGSSYASPGKSFHCPSTPVSYPSKLNSGVTFSGMSYPTYLNPESNSWEAPSHSSYITMASFPCLCMPSAKGLSTLWGRDSVLQHQAQCLTFGLINDYLWNEWVNKWESYVYRKGFELLLSSS